MSSSVDGKTLVIYEVRAVGLDWCGKETAQHANVVGLPEVFDQPSEIQWVRDQIAGGPYFSLEFIDALAITRVHIEETLFDEDDEKVTVIARKEKVLQEFEPYYQQQYDRYDGQ